jgi:hypothetical protein
LHGCSVGVVVYVDSTVEVVAASLGAHAAAIDVVEHDAPAVPVLLLDASLDPAVPGFLAAAGGAAVHRSGWTPAGMWACGR